MDVDAAINGETERADSTWPPASDERNPLRLGVLLDSFHVPAWFYALLQAVTTDAAVNLAVVIVGGRQKACGNTSASEAVFGAWFRLDRWMRRSQSDALRMVDARALLAGVRCIDEARRADGPEEKTQNNLAQAIRSAGVELLLHLGSEALHDEVIASAPYGVWSLGEAEECRSSGIYGVPPRFSEAYEAGGFYPKGVSLVEWRAGGSRLIHRTSGESSPVSLAVYQNEAYWKMGEFLSHRLGQGRHAWQDGAAVASSAQQVQADRQQVSTACASKTWQFLLGWPCRVLRHQFQKRVLYEQWGIALFPKQAAGGAGNSRRYVMMEPPRDRFYADPFLIERNGRNYLFVEEYLFGTEKGVISCCEVDEAGHAGIPQVVLEREYHLSYPSLYEWEGEVFMIPESQDSGRVELYRAVNFPYSWTRDAVLMESTTCVDATVLHHRDHWWMFAAGVNSRRSVNDTLHLFYAKSLRGPWRSHPQNPIVSDVHRARPAGHLFVENGRLMRPAQDCSKTYGYAIQVHEVEEISETIYRERPVRRIAPGLFPGSIGTHTLNQSSKFWVLDRRVFVSRIGARSQVNRECLVPAAAASAIFSDRVSVAESGGGSPR